MYHQIDGNKNVRHNISEVLKKYNADPVVKAMTRERGRELMTRPEMLAGLSKRILQINPATLVVVARYKSVRDASRTTGINHGNICTCARNEKDCAGGFVWKFDDSNEEAFISPAALVKINSKARGEKCPWTPFDADDIKRLRNEWNEATDKRSRIIVYKTWMKKKAVSRQAILSIVHNLSWKHVT